MTAVLQLDRIVKIYRMGETEVHALRGIDLRISKGEMVSIMGPSGCGKSTLLQIVGCLDKPTSGRVVISGSDVSNLEDEQLAKIRNKYIGFVFQSFNLLPYEDALNNVMVPLQYGGVPKKKAEEAARQALASVGLEKRIHHKPNELSGGQRQRVAIARAIVNQPSVILADEPTGALDQASGREVMGILQKFNSEGRTIVVVTHDRNVANYSQRVVELCDGSIVKDSPVKKQQVGSEIDLRDEGMQAVRPGQKFCVKCNASNRPIARFCQNCGASLEMNPVISKTIMGRILGLKVPCRSCGSANRPFARYCMACGGSMDPTAV
jgi:putative ABC transport system ATP-binding protein